MENIIRWFESSSIHQWIISNNSSVIVFEIMHFFGLCLLLGALLIIDLRMLGRLKLVPIHTIHSLLPVVFIGFGLNLLSGVLFVFYDPGRYLINIGFHIKMALVVLAGLNALFYYWKIHPQMAGWHENAATPAIARFVGASSLILWYGVLVSGRFIPYVGTG